MWSPSLQDPSVQPWLYQAVHSTHASSIHQRNGHVTREAKPERRTYTRVEPCRRPASRHNDSVDGTGVPQLGRGEKNEGVDGTVVAGGDLVGDVVKTSSHILRSPSSTTQDEIAFDKQHMMSLPRQGRERSIVVVVSSSIQQRRDKDRILTRGAASF